MFDNGVYEVTGEQPIPGAGAVDFVAIAKAAGFCSTFEFSDSAAWQVGGARRTHRPGADVRHASRRDAARDAGTEITRTRVGTRPPLMDALRA